MGTLYLDLDGTIINTSKRHYAVYSAILRRHGYKPLSQAAYWRLKRADRPYNEILRFSHVSQAHVATFHAEWLQEIEKPRYLACDVLQPGAKRALSSLSSLSSLCPFRLILVTLRQKRRSLLGELSRLGIRNFFANVFSATPSKTPWEQKAELIRKDGIKKDGKKESFIIGDSGADILAGRALGITSIAVTNGIRSKGALRKLRPKFIARSLPEAACLITFKLARQCKDEGKSK